MAPRMSRIAPTAALPVGVPPVNFYKVLGNSPSALDAYLALKRALVPGTLDSRSREEIALVIAKRNRSEYCRVVHANALQKLGGPAPRDPKTEAVIDLARNVLEGPDGSALERARAAGVSEEEALEVVAHVALNLFSNAVNVLAGTNVDVIEAAPIEK